MEVWSFTEIGATLQPVKIELSLMAGLPEFVITGLPDQTIKESLIRIRSALKHQGFQLPKAEKVLINLSPNNEKKSGRGIELAIALAYLAETGQMQNIDSEKIFAYGELGLKGEVRFLEEINWAPVPVGQKIISGYPRESSTEHELTAIHNLGDILQPEIICSNSSAQENKTRCFDKVTWGQETADLLALLAHGGHHALLAGPAGSGKSTLAKSLHQVLPDISDSENSELRRWDRYFHRERNLRPYENPHHSSTVQALLGGGNPPVPGVITRAHHGLLVMDEFLEFPPKVREGLREALESGEITLARKGHVERLPAIFQLVATTNLCPCGDYVPGRLSSPCRYTLNKCQSYQERLSGPLLDRFDVLSLSNTWSKSGPVPLQKIFEQVTQAGNFQKIRGQAVPNGRLKWDDVLGELSHPNLLQYMPSTLKSRRRSLAILRVARSLADLRAKEKIALEHINAAIAYSAASFF